MRKNAKYMIVSLLMFCFISNVKAEECTYEKQVELNNIASTVKATYEEVEIDTGETTFYVDPETDEIDFNKEIPVYETGFQVKILNLTEDIFVEVNNENKNVKKTYHYSDSNDGTIVVSTAKADEIINYTIKINAAGSTCTGNELRTISLVIPKYNSFSELSFCSEYPEFQYCDDFITVDYDIDFNEFFELAKNYSSNNEKKNVNVNESEDRNFVTMIKEFYKENKKVIIIVTSIVAIAGVATAAIIVVRRRSRLI